MTYLWDVAVPHFGRHILRCRVAPETSNRSSFSANGDVAQTCSDGFYRHPSAGFPRFLPILGELLWTPVFGLSHSSSTLSTSQLSFACVQAAVVTCTCSQLPGSL